MHETDKFLELTDELASYVPECVLEMMPRNRRKMRITYDTKTGELRKRIVKARVADLDIGMPGEPLDCRISISIEMPWTGPAAEVERLLAAAAQRGGAGGSPDRLKDRLSYSQWPLQVDLTQVRQTPRVSGGGRMPFSRCANVSS